MWDVNGWFEGQVSARLPIRVWHLVALTLLLLVALVVLACCLFNCRIPRTRQQILRKRRESYHRTLFQNHLKLLTNIDQPFESVLQEIVQLEQKRIENQNERSLSNVGLMQKLKLILLYRKVTSNNNADDANFNNFDNTNSNCCNRPISCSFNHDNDIERCDSFTKTSSITREARKLIEPETPLKSLLSSNKTNTQDLHNEKKQQKEANKHLKTNWPDLRITIEPETPEMIRKQSPLIKNSLSSL